jgi:hypothetical protein
VRGRARPRTQFELLRDTPKEGAVYTRAQLLAVRAG